MCWYNSNNFKGGSSVKINARVLNVRKHKNYIFLDCYTKEFSKIQLMVDKNEENLLLKAVIADV